MKNNRLPIVLAISAAVCYGISAPVSKLLLNSVPPAFMAALLYIGAGIGMLGVRFVSLKGGEQKEAHITKSELPFTVAMVGLDIAAPILLMFGLTITTSATASLLNNFEIVATTIIALAVFKEAVGKRMWLAIGLITLASIILTVEDFGKLSFSIGSFLVILACVCWGIENNCTSKLSLKDPLQIVIIKGFGSGIGALIIAFMIGENTLNFVGIAAALVLGFVAYGLSIYFYIRAQRGLGAARTSAFYAIAPFMGVGLSFVVFREMPTLSFWLALIIMVIGTYMAAFEKHSHDHSHVEVEHNHRHSHNDGHHNHTHTPPVKGEHSHVHFHEAFIHNHQHMPDTHHIHTH